MIFINLKTNYIQNMYHNMNIFVTKDAIQEWVNNIPSFGHHLWMNSFIYHG
jgi:hypothetical protein